MVSNYPIQFFCCLETAGFQKLDLHMSQLMPLPLTVSCFSKIQIGFTFLVPAHPGSPAKEPLNGCVRVPYRLTDKLRKLPIHSPCPSRIDTLQWLICHGFMSQH